MDLNAVRTFVAVADAGQFQRAAAELSLTQQAVSRRVAALESDLGVRLLTRTARGASLSIDGQAFLPHARALLQAQERAAASVRPGSRALRVDVIGRRLATAGLLRDFHRAHPAIDLDVVTLFHDVSQAVQALRSGAIDASFRAVPLPGRQLRELRSIPVFDEPLLLCVGPAHAFAAARAVTPAELAGCRIWMPGNVPGTEWHMYYEDMAAAFGLTIDTVGPNFGVDALLDTVSDSPTLATFLGERTPLVWPADHDLRLIPLRDPTPVYPHSLLWRADNPHPGLAALHAHLAATTAATTGAAGTWRPAWGETG